jgi:hypothetical protein
MTIINPQKRKNHPERDVFDRSGWIIKSISSFTSTANERSNAAIVPRLLYRLSRGLSKMWVAELTWFSPDPQLKRQWLAVSLATNACASTWFMG